LNNNKKYLWLVTYCMVCHSKENELSSTEIGLLHIDLKWKEKAQVALYY